MQNKTKTIAYTLGIRLKRDVENPTQSVGFLVFEFYPVKVEAIVDVTINAKSIVGMCKSRSGMMFDSYLLLLYVSLRFLNMKYVWKLHISITPANVTLESVSMTLQTVWSSCI